MVAFCGLILMVTGVPGTVCMANPYCDPPDWNMYGVPVPLSASPLTPSLPLPPGTAVVRKLPLPSEKKAELNAPPVAGFKAMVQPDAGVERHMVGTLAGGMVVLTMIAPASTMGLKT